jgi:hypothetical protein
MRRTKQMRRRIWLIVERREQRKVDCQQNEKLHRREERKIACNTGPEHGCMLTPRIRPGHDLNQSLAGVCLIHVTLGYFGCLRQPKGPRDRRAEPFRTVCGLVKPGD